MKLTKILTLVLTLATANISAMEGDSDYSLKDLQNEIRSLQKFLIKSNFDNDQSKKQDALGKIRNLPVSIDGKKSLDVYDEKISKELVHDIRILVNLIYSKLYNDENDLSIKKRIVDCSSDLAKMQSDLVLYGSQIIKKHEDNTLLLDLSRLYKSFVKNFAIEKTKKLNILKRIWGYNPEMVALRKTFVDFNPDIKTNHKSLASIFSVPNDKMFDFLYGFDSKTVLNNFYTLMKEKQYVKDGLDTADNSFNITETEQDPFLKKIN